MTGKLHKPLLKGGRYFPLAGEDRPERSVERAGWLLSGVKDDASLDEEEDGA